MRQWCDASLANEKSVPFARHNPWIFSSTVPLRGQVAEIYLRRVFTIAAHIAALRSAMNNNKAETVTSWTGLIARVRAEADRVRPALVNPPAGVVIQRRHFMRIIPNPAAIEHPASLTGSLSAGGV
jgi:hypothetical protein